MPIPIIDAHLDLAWNALSFNRDLTRSVEEVRRSEQGMTDEPSRGRNTLTLSELRRASIPVCVATLLARGGPEQPSRSAYKRTDLDHASQSIAHAAAHGQLAYYRLLARQGHVRWLRTREELDAHWQSYESVPAKTPLGIVLSMEGADPVTTPAEVDEWYAIGLRAIGPAHYGRSHYAYGTAVCGPLSPMGVDLIRRMQRLGMILDVTHLCDESMDQAFELYDGPVWASHHNARSLVPGDRQLTDEQIKELIRRGAVVGVALDAWMLYPNWVRGQTKPDVISLEAVADQIDHVCRLAGNTDHSCIGSDLDGGFGTEQTPRDLDTIADLQKLAGILLSRGYSDEDVRKIFHGNMLRFLRAALP